MGAPSKNTLSERRGSTSSEPKKVTLHNADVHYELHEGNVPNAAKRLSFYNADAWSDFFT